MSRARVRRFDPLRLDVFQHLFAAAAEEMGAALLRSSFSTNIRERRDFSCALFDGQGRMVGQAAHLPVHLGSTPMSVRAAIEHCVMGPGDAVLLNDPYRGGTHLPDLTLVSPVFLPGSTRPDFFCANRAHHADVGGAVPGSMAPADDVHGEGLRIPPLHLVRAGKIERPTLSLILANMRCPDEREGDLLAQWATNRIGESRLLALAAEQGARELRGRAQELMDWTERLTRALLSSLPARRVRFADTLEEPGGKDAFIRLELVKRGATLSCDFRATDSVPRSSLSATLAVTHSAVFYCLSALLPPGTPANDGILRPVRILTRPGTLVDAAYPAGVAAGNVETSQRIVDVLFGALNALVPERIPAASAGTMSNLTFAAAAVPGGPSAFTYYETIPGGAGASAVGPGESGLQTHMTNTRNTPIEAFERTYPVRVERLELRRSSGGRGARAGGDGVRKRVRFLIDVQAAFIGDRQRRGPWGLAGGAAGAPGRLRQRAGPSAPWKALPAQWSGRIAAGGELEVETPGGGGHGRARRTRESRRKS
ncbi:MAG: hydantoinase B/oxoprolinase family protein [Planctomycetes bacterium]|nr:hydantoinase B/oxoprolinase family protein [Planctomycetota bacterium]